MKIKVVTNPQPSTGPWTQAGESIVEPHLLSSIVRELSLQAEPSRGLVVAVTSAAGGEGKSTIADALGRGLAPCVPRDRQVLVVDCSDPPGPGQSAAPARLTGNRFAGQKQLICCTLRVLEIDARPPHLAGLAASLETLRGRHPFVVLDLPPILDDPLAAELGRAADRLYLVVRAGATSLLRLDEALDRLSPRAPDGIILNGVRPTLPRWLARLIS